MRVALAPLLAACVVACSGRVAPEMANVGTEGAIADGGGGADAGGSAATIEQVDATAHGREEVGAKAPPDPAAMEAACDAIVEATCSADTKGCCDSKGVAWDEAACRAKARASCIDDLAAVAAGRRGYDPTKLADCLTGWHVIGSTCNVARNDAVRTLLNCDLVFPAAATASYRRICTRDADCPPYPDAIGYCEQRDHYATNQCAWLRIGPRASADAWESVSPVCVPGESLCARPVASGPAVWQCAPDLPIGAACGASTLDACCGSDAHCDITIGKCVARKPVGATCDDDCESWNCSCGGADRWSPCTSPTHTCAPGSPYSAFTSLAVPELCSGAAGSISVALVDWRLYF